MVIAQLFATERVRLHITPFNRDLLEKLLPPSTQSQASNISFHAVQTSPERGFGFLELPAMEAQKLKKKFNGTTLKGTKVRVEEAKPERKRKPDLMEVDQDEKISKKAKKEKKQRENGVLLGHELEKGRIVKRGWADDANLKKAKKDKKEDDDNSLKKKKMHFKTNLPPTVAAAETAANPKGKKRKVAAAKSAKMEVVVKEFSKTSKPKWSKPTTSSGQAVTYEDGKGWLDSDGNVVEAERPSQRRRRTQALSSPTRETADQNESRTKTEHDLNSGNDPETIDLVHKNGQLKHAEPAKRAVSKSPLDDEDESSSLDSGDDSLESEDESDSSSSASSSQDQILPQLPIDQSEQTSISSTNEDVQSIDKEIHPLEALYKRSQPKDDDATSNQRPTPIDTSFSFFGGGDAGDVEMHEGNEQMPQTPQTKKNLEWRSIRSAAPTPDTAVAGKRFSFALADDEEEGEDDEEEFSYRNNPPGGEEGPAAESLRVDEGEGQPKEESEFRKWFYENRGDLNRGWKKRRREDRKLGRQRENRRLSRRIA